MDDILQSEEMQEILHDFIVETVELLDDLDQKLVELEKAPSSEDLLNSIFRSVHTIKGASGFLGLEQLVGVAHIAENVLNKLRQGTLKVTPTIMDALLQSVDMLKLLVDHVKEKDGKKEDTSAVIARLTAIEQEEPAQEEKGKAKKEKKPKKAAKTKKIAKAGQSKEPEEVKEQESAPVEVKAPEPGPTAQAGGAPAVEFRRRKDDLDTIRVDTERLDEVMNMVGELVLGRNRLMRISAQLDDRYGEDEIVISLKETAAHLDLITTDVQLSVMKTRMQLIAKVFGRFPRMVRDLAREKKKEVSLVLVGEDTELDKSVIEEIGDPLVHLVRNAVDHGIELPADRKEAGKATTGTLTLSAVHRGNHINIIIEDDGKGLDIEGIKAKAAKKGLATPEEMDRMSEKEILNFIFLPGFSTAEVVTSTSGRGVGMDVVKTNIAKLNGTIDVETTLGKGSKFILSLPLTLAIIHALMVRVGSDDFALPLSSVEEILNIEKSDIKTVEGKEVIHWRDRVYPLVRLSRITGASVSTDIDKTIVYAVLIAYGDKTVALLAEELLGQEEVVIKSMGEYLSDIKGVSGATITGDGRVVLILDVAGLFETARTAALTA